MRCFRCNQPWRTRHSPLEETGVPRFPRRRISSMIIARSVKNKTVTPLVRARERQARAAIWFPFPCDSATGGKAVSGS